MLGRARASPTASSAGRRASAGPDAAPCRIAQRLRTGVIRPRAVGDLAASGGAAAPALAASSAAAPARQQQQQQEEQQRIQQAPAAAKAAAAATVRAGGPAGSAAAATAAATAAARALSAALPALAALLAPVARAAWARRQAVEHLLFGRPLRFPGDGADATAPALNGGQRLAMSAALVAVVAEAAATGGAAPAASSSSLLPTLPGNGFNDLFTNRVFLAGYWAWFAAQLLKIFTKRARKGVWDVRAIVDSGGMPSSHSALCAGITTALAMQQGLGSSAFAMGVAFTAVVMYDAAGVRRHAGRQAEVLNAVVGELLDDGHALSSVKLKEVLGHTPLQVVMGAVLGVMVGIFFPAV